MKKENGYTGEVPLRISDDLEGILLFDWAALGAMNERFARSDEKGSAKPIIPANLMDMNPMDLAVLAEIGFMAKSPHITRDAIIKASPTVLDVAQAVDKALLIAYHGPERARAIHEQMAGITKAVDESTGTKKNKKTS